MTSPTSGQNYFVDRWRKLAFKLRIKGDAKLVLLALVELYAGHKDGSNCYPSIDSLVWHTELSRRTVQRALDLLEERGIVTRIQCVGTSNLYEFGDADALESAIPERPSPASRRHMRQPDTRVDLTPPLCQPDTPPVSHGHPPCVSLTPYHSQGTPSLNTPNEQAAATHTREGERTHEAGQPAAPKGQDLDLDHEQPKQAAAASREPTATPTVRTGAELEGWFSGQLKERRADLVVTPEPITPRQVKACLRAILAHAAGDEAQVRAYLTERLDAYEMRGDARPRSCKVLLGFLADRGDYATWERERHEMLARPPETRPLWQQRSNGRGQLTGHFHSPSVQAKLDSGWLKD